MKYILVLCVGIGMGIYFSEYTTVYRMSCYQQIRNDFKGLFYAH
jgi:ABC-type phosphate transport system permease subunit